MHLPYFALHYSVALDMGTAWTRAASPEGRCFSVESRHGGMPGLASDESERAVTSPTLLREILRMLRPGCFGRPRVVAAVSSCASERTRDRVTRSLRESGAWSVSLIPQPLAAAIGAGLDPGSDYARMMVDIGESFTEYAIIRSGRVEMSDSTKLGCGTFRRVIAHSNRRQAGFHPPVPADELLHWMERHSLDEARPRVMNGDLARELERLLAFVAEGCSRFFQKLPDRVACEVIENGITLVGGGALLRDVQKRVAARTGLSVCVPGNPLTSVIEGATQSIPYAFAG